MKGFYGMLADMYDHQLMAVMRAHYTGGDTLMGEHFGEDVRHFARAEAKCLVASITETEPARRFVATPTGVVAETVPCMKFDPTGTPVPVSATPIERN